MKRTRRVEVITYSRRSRVISYRQGPDPVAPDDLWETLGENESSKRLNKLTLKKTLTGAGDAHVARKARLFGFLKRLIRG